ncbi:MAG: DUF2314 domain-containing protein [Gemmataceae bacterium]
MSEKSKVYQAEGDDPDMLRAYENARATFRYFWREVMWDRNRIVPALGMAMVKAPFSDGPTARRKPGVPNVEHMWIDDVDFDGQTVFGTLQNSPNWLESVQAGAAAQFPRAEISDWLYVIGEEAYGAFTVNVLRSRMDKKERAQHDGMWGLNFGDPNKPRTAPDGEGESPLSKSAAASLQQALAKDPKLIASTGHRSWTMLHHHASAGNTTLVKLLLEAGADVNAKTSEGFTALQIAQVLGWKDIAALLT